MYESFFWVKQNKNEHIWSLMYGWGERYTTANREIMGNLPTWKAAQTIANAFNNSQPTHSQVVEAERKFPGLEIEE